MTESKWLYVAAPIFLLGCYDILCFVADLIGKRIKKNQGRAQ